jgi:hypothetical protein
VAELIRRERLPKVESSQGLIRSVALMIARIRPQVNPGMLCPLSLMVRHWDSWPDRLGLRRDPSETRPARECEQNTYTPLEKMYVYVLLTPVL